MNLADSMRYGFRLAQRAERTPNIPLMPRDENDARGIGARYGLTAAEVTQNLGPLGITIAKLRELSAKKKAAVAA